MLPTTTPKYTLPADLIVAGTRTPLSCPLCAEGVLVVRQNRATGSYFLSCDLWPTCDGKGSILRIADEQPTLL